MVKMKCEECGWVYDPEKGVPESNIPANVAWGDVSGDFVCPVCSADKDHFVPLEQ